MNLNSWTDLICINTTTPNVSSCCGESDANRNIIMECFFNVFIISIWTVSLFFFMTIFSLISKQQYPQKYVYLTYIFENTRFFILEFPKMYNKIYSHQFHDSSCWAHRIKMQTNVWERIRFVIEFWMKNQQFRT